jgi:Type I phosphodiesterase / nucleotide pyrophosphatase
MSAPAGGAGAGVPSSEDRLSPRYGTASLLEVLPSALAAVGAGSWADDAFDNALGFPECTAYVVLLVDGMGLELLREHPNQTPYLTSLGLDRELTSGVPSTTVTSIASLGTGLPPGQHGLVGFTSRIPGTEDLLDALSWDRRVDPISYQPHPTLFERARSAGVTATVVSRTSFETSGLTLATQRGANYAGFDTRAGRLAAAVLSAQVPRSLTYLYEGRLDSTGHRAGCRSSDWRDQLVMIDAFAEELRAALPATAVLVVTADHGMVDIAFEQRLQVDHHPNLMTGVRLLGGEARFRHLYCEPDAADDVRARWAKTMGPDAIVLTQAEAIERGWFGAVDIRVADRLGDVIVASVGETAVVSDSRFPREAELVGLHGSVTSAEMLVPLLVDAA